MGHEGWRYYLKVILVTNQMTIFLDFGFESVFGPNYGMLDLHAHWLPSSKRVFSICNVTGNVVSHDARFFLPKFESKRTFLALFKTAKRIEDANSIKNVLFRCSKSEICVSEFQSPYRGSRDCVRPNFSPQSQVYFHNVKCQWKLENPKI